MVVIDHFDERLDLAAFLHPLLTHAAGDFCGISLDAGNKSVWEGMLLCARVHWLYDYDLINPLVSVSKYKLADISMRRDSRGDRHTFLPAYLPLVIIATRPTLRTGKDGQHASLF